MFYLKYNGVLLRSNITTKSVVKKIAGKGSGFFFEHKISTNMYEYTDQEDNISAKMMTCK